MCRLQLGRSNLNIVYVQKLLRLMSLLSLVFVIKNYVSWINETCSEYKSELSD